MISESISKITTSKSKETWFPDFYAGVNDGESLGLAIALMMLVLLVFLIIEAMPIYLLLLPIRKQLIKKVASQNLFSVILKRILVIYLLSVYLVTMLAFFLQLFFPHTYGWKILVSI